MDGRRRRSGSRPAGRTIPDGPTSDPGRPTVYRVRISGQLDDRWADEYEGLTIAREACGETVLTVPVVDQAALHGLLRKLRDLGAPLVSIDTVRSDLPRTAPREEKER